MNAFKIKLTTAGLAALVDENNIGTAALQITTLELGSNFYDPSASQNSLQASIKTLNTFGGVAVDNGIIHISIRDESNDAYELGEIGLRTGTGVLLGIVSSAEGLITTKGANDVLLVAADLAITDADISNIVFGETNFIYQPGTEDKEGIYELATDAEVDAAEANKVIDAAKMQSGITRRSSSEINVDDAQKIATSAAIYALTQLIQANNNSISTINTLLQSDNADLDKLQEIVDYIEVIKGTQDTLAISNIASLQDALNDKVNNSRVLTSVPMNAVFSDTNTHREISDSTSSTSSTVSASSTAVKEVMQAVNNIPSVSRVGLGIITGTVNGAGVLSITGVSGWSASRTDRGRYTITHDLGTLDYTVTTGNRGGDATVSRYSHEENDFSIATKNHNNGSDSVDVAFDFTVFVNG